MTDRTGPIPGARFGHTNLIARDWRRLARSSFDPPVPNSMSKATRGSRIIGSGSFGDAQLIESV